MFDRLTRVMPPLANSPSQYCRFCDPDNYDKPAVLGEQTLREQQQDAMLVLVKASSCEAFKPATLIKFSDPATYDANRMKDIIDIASE